MPKYNGFTMALVLAYVTVLMIPEVWSAYLHVGDVPLAAIIMAVLSVTVLLQLAARPEKVTAELVLGAVALLLMTVYGFSRGNIGEYSVKFFVFDTYCGVALLTGYALARVQIMGNITRMVSVLVVAATYVIVASYIGLFAGFLEPVLGRESDRFVTSSIYAASALLLIGLPLASIAQSVRKTGLMVLIAAAASLLSATRSMLIVTIAAALLCCVLRLRHLNCGWVYRASIGVAVTVGLSVSGLSLLDSNVFGRLGTTELGKEARYVELVAFWSQVSDDVVAGQGMGSRFVSNVVVQGNPLASAPHIGIAAFLMKGGVFAFLMFALAPCIASLVVLFSSKRSDLRRGGAASVLVFTAMACLSGGWEPLALFCYGVAISVMVGDFRPSGSSGPLVGTRRATTYGPRVVPTPVKQ